jgi:SAM-dependent methyltransferase
MVTRTFYLRHGYDSHEYNRRGLFSWEEEAIHAHFPDRARLLLLGAGGGREILALAPRGFDVAGFECNPTLAAAANRFLHDAQIDSTVRWLPRDAVPTYHEQFDGAIVGWGAYMLIIGSERRIRFLRELAECLLPGAPVLISFHTWDGSTRQVHWIRRIANTIRSLLRRHEADLGDDLVPNFIHRFTADEVELELREAGFTLREFRNEGPGPYDSGFAVGERRGSSRSTGRTVSA